MGVGEADDLKQIVGMVRLSFGLCLPKACSADSIQILWNHLEYTFGLQGHLSMNEDFCTYKGKVPFRFPFDGLILYVIFCKYFKLTQMLLSDGDSFFTFYYCAWLLYMTS